MTTNRRLFALGVLLIPVLTSASDPVNCDDIKYVGANKLFILLRIQDANPAYQACVSTMKFTQASKDLDTAYSATAITDDNFRAQSRELNQNRKELGYEEVVRYSNITIRAFKHSGGTEKKGSGSILSFGSLHKPVSTASGYTTITAGE